MITLKEVRNYHLQWGVSFQSSFRPNSAWGSIVYRNDDLRADAHHFIKIKSYDFVLEIRHENLDAPKHDDENILNQISFDKRFKKDQLRYYSEIK